MQQPITQKHLSRLVRVIHEAGCTRIHLTNGAVMLSKAKHLWSSPLVDRSRSDRDSSLRSECQYVMALRVSYPFVVKKSRRFKFDEVRQRFRLTPTEKRVAVFVVAAFVLGLITKCYRDAHPSPTPVQTHSGKSRVSRSSSAKVDQPRAPNAGNATRRTAKTRRKT